MSHGTDTLGHVHHALRGFAILLDPSYPLEEKERGDVWFLLDLVLTQLATAVEQIATERQGVRPPQGQGANPGDASP